MGPTADPGAAVAAGLGEAVAAMEEVVMVGGTKHVQAREESTSRSASRQYWP